MFLEYSTEHVPTLLPSSVLQQHYVVNIIFIWNIIQIRICEFIMVLNIFSIRFIQTEMPLNIILLQINHTDGILHNMIHYCTYKST